MTRSLAILLQKHPTLVYYFGISKCYMSCFLVARLITFVYTKVISQSRMVFVMFFNKMTICMVTGVCLHEARGLDFTDSVF